MKLFFKCDQNGRDIDRKLGPRAYIGIRKTRKCTITPLIYTTNMCDLGGKHINVWVADSVVQKNSENFYPEKNADPLSWAQDGQNLISWRWSLPLSANLIWWRSMHAISNYRGNISTHKQTHNHTHKHTQTHRQDRLQYTAPQLASAQCNKAEFLVSCAQPTGKNLF